MLYYIYISIKKMAFKLMLNSQCNVGNWTIQSKATVLGYVILIWHFDIMVS